MIKRLIGEFFTFSRSERRGIILLLVLMVIVMLVKTLLSSLYQSRPTDFSQYREEIAQFEQSIVLNEGLPAEDHKYYSRADSAIAVRKQASPVISYPQAGKIAGLSTETGEEEYNKSLMHKAAVRQVLINLNLSDSLELKKIKGVGPVLSQRIVKYRYLIGGFTCKEQLQEVYGINRDNYDQIAGQVYIDTAGIRYIFLNTAGYEMLCRHPYLDDYQAKAIISFREVNGRYLHTGQLLEENILPAETYNRIKDYFKTE